MSCGYPQHFSMMEKQTLYTQSFYIGPWFVEPSFNKISANNNTVQLQPKMMDVLVCLAASAGTPVSYDELIWEVWADLEVRDNVLHRTISNLRKILATTSEETTFIKTIPKKGYCLILPVTKASHEVVYNGLSIAEQVSDSLPATNQVLATPEITRRNQYPWLLSLSIFSLAILLFLLFTPRESSSTFSVLPRLFTSAAGLEVHPSFSPDGDQLAYVWFDPEGGADIYVQAVDNETPKRITTSKRFEYHPVWSADGQSLAYYSFDNSKVTDCWIMIQPLTGGNAKLAAPCDKSNQRKLAWSADGNWMAYEQLDTTSGSWRIQLLALDSQESRPISPPDSTPFEELNFAFSPDSQDLLYYRYNPTSGDSRGDLFKANLEDATKPIEKVTENFGYLYNFGWAYETDEIFFLSLRDKKRGLWHMDVDEYKPQLVTTIPEIFGSLAVAPRGDHIAYVSWNYEENIWRSALPSDEKSEPDRNAVIESTRRDGAPQFSPDGEKLAFVSNRTGFFELWISDANGRNQQNLTSLNSTVRSPRWSPDGRSIAVHALQNGHLNIFTVDVDTGTIDQITNNGADDMLPAWSQNGKSLFFTSARSGDYQIWQIDLASKETQQVTTQGGLASFEALDGESLYFTRNGEPGIWEYDFASGQEEQLTCNLHQNNYLSWAPAANAIYYIMGAGNNKSNLMRYDLEKGESIALMEINRTSNQADDGLGLAISPDEQWVVYGRVDEQSSDIMLIDTE